MQKSTEGDAEQENVANGDVVDRMIKKIYCEAHICMGECLST